LKAFQSLFGIPISHGGYVNATSFHVQTAYKCSVTLKDLISPYLLRRMKKDVNHNLPKKTEQILFCKLSSTQVSFYKDYLSGKDVKNCLNAMDDEKDITFRAIANLRKICNHPDLFEDSTQKVSVDDVERSGKLALVNKLLPLWKENNHRVLLYSQSVKMLNIFEDLLKSLNYKYLRMDGSTNISERQDLIDKFNRDESIFIFILTTKVGGIGINLTGADRILIYDPDCNSIFF
jgi:DNA excision repair protein ERCC-6